MNVPYRLLPMIIEGLPEEPTESTVIGDFAFLTYLEAMEDDFAPAGDVAEPEGYSIVAVIEWMGVPVQQHQVLIPEGVDAFTNLIGKAEALAHIKALHTSFDDYMMGRDSVFPAFRALGWVFLTPQAIITVQMEEQRNFSKAVAMGNHALDEMVDWLSATGELCFDEIGDLGVVDNVAFPPAGENKSDPLGVNHNENVQKFIQQMEDLLHQKLKEDNNGNTK